MGVLIALPLDLLPAYIPFEKVSNTAAGVKTNPTATPTVSIYEEGGADNTFDNSEIAGSPFTCAIINAKVGNYGVLVDKSLFTAGNFYRVLWEWTVDGNATSEEDTYFAYNAASYKADVSALATSAALATHDGKLDTVDGIVDDILEDTAALDADWADGGRLDLILDEATLRSQEACFPLGVHFDNVLGAAGTAYPLGTILHPVNDEANAKTIADNNNIRIIHVEGDWVTPAAMQYYAFTGNGHINTTFLFNINNQDVDHSSFRDLILTGAQAGGSSLTDCIMATNCLLYSLSSFNGIARTCQVGNTLSLKNNGYITFDDVEFSILADTIITVNSPSRCEFSGVGGHFTLATMTGGAVNIHSAKGCAITIANSCTAGTINIYGNAVVTNNTGGTTVNFYDIITEINANETKIDTIDTVVDAVLVDTNEIQGKLPTNNIMGSSVKTDKDDEIDAILADTAALDSRVPTNPATEEKQNLIFAKSGEIRNVSEG